METTFFSDLKQSPCTCQVGKTSDWTFFSYEPQSRGPMVIQLLFLDFPLDQSKTEKALYHR